MAIPNLAAIPSLFKHISGHKDLLKITFGNEHFRGTIDNYDENNNYLNIVLDNSIKQSGHADIEVSIHFRNVIYYFVTYAIEASGVRMKAVIPRSMNYHSQRDSKRREVSKEYKIPIRLTIIGAGQDKNKEKINLAPDPNLRALFREAGKVVPDTSKIISHSNKIISKLGDIGGIYFKGIDALIRPAYVLLNKFHSPYYIKDSSNRDSYTRDDWNFIDAKQFTHFLSIENPGKGTEKHNAIIERWMDEYKKRDIFSEIYIPITIMASVVGYVHLGVHNGSFKKIGPEELGILAQICTTTAEALIKKNINSREEKDIYNVMLRDVSKQGIGFTVEDTIFTKILREGLEVVIDMKIRYQWIKIVGEIIWVCNEEENIEKNGFAVSIDFQKTSPKDKVYWYRIENFFQ